MIQRLECGYLVSMFIVHFYTFAHNLTCLVRKHVVDVRYWLTEIRLVSRVSIKLSSSDATTMFLGSQMKFAKFHDSRSDQ